MLFGGWESLFRILVVGVLAYFILIVFLRVSGNRTLSKMNAFDLVVTIALGSILATVLLAKDVALAEGVFAFALLIGLQFVVSWSSVRAPWVQRVATGEPQMLLYCGEFLAAAMQQARVTEDNVRAAIRSAGIKSLDKVHAVILETDGSFTVVQSGGDGNESSLVGVNHPKEFSEPFEK